MQILERIRAQAASSPKHVVLPEGEDERTIRAAALCMQERLASLTLIGNEDIIRGTASRIGVSLTGASIIDHRRSRDREQFAVRYYEARRAKGVTLDEANRQIDDPLYFGNMMVR